MQLEEVIVKVVDVQGLSLTRDARTGWENLDPNALESFAITRKIFSRNAEGHVLIATLRRRHPLHGRYPDSAEDKELLARDRKVLAVAVINLDSTETVTHEAGHAIKVSN